jgi:hypothetical protein
MFKKTPKKTPKHLVLDVLTADLPKGVEYDMKYHLTNYSNSEQIPENSYGSAYHYDFYIVEKGTDNIVKDVEEYEINDVIRENHVVIGFIKNMRSGFIKIGRKYYDVGEYDDEDDDTPNDNRPEKFSNYLEAIPDDVHEIYKKMKEESSKRRSELASRASNLEVSKNGKLSSPPPISGGGKNRKSKSRKSKKSRKSRNKNKENDHVGRWFL